MGKIAALATLVCIVLLCAGGGSRRLVHWLRRKGWQRPYDDELERKEKRARSAAKRGRRAVDANGARDMEEMTPKTRKGKSQGRRAAIEAEELSQINIDADYEQPDRLSRRAKPTRKDGRRGRRSAEMEQICSSESDSARYDREPPRRAKKTAVSKHGTKQAPSSSRAASKHGGSKRGPAVDPSVAAACELYEQHMAEAQGSETLYLTHAPSY